MNEHTLNIFEKIEADRNPPLLFCADCLREYENNRNECAAFSSQGGAMLCVFRACNYIAESTQLRNSMTRCTNVDRDMHGEWMAL